MAQGEIFEIVISAVNKAAPALANTSKSLDLVQQSVVGLNASMQQTVGGAQFNTNSFREVSAGIKEFHGRSKEWSGHLKVSHVEATKFASNIGGSVITALTRLAGPIAAATISIDAFRKKLTSSKQLNELSRALGVPKEIIKGIRRLNEEAGVSSEETDTILTDLFGKFEHMQFPSDRGDLWDKLYKIDDTRGLAITLAKIWDDVALGKISGVEGRKKSILETQKFLKEYNDVWKEPGTRLLLETGLGLSPKLEVLGRTPTDEFAKSISGLGKTTNDLDAEQVEKFWKAWREFSRALDQFTKAVLTPLLPKITEFITRLTNDPRLMDFVKNVFPQLCKQIEKTYLALKDAMEGAPLDWNKIFGGGLLERMFTDFFNQLKTRWQQIVAATPFGSQEALTAARKAELQYRKDNLFGLSAEEEQELMNIEAGGIGAARPIFMPKVSPEQEKDIRRRMEEYQQQQRFTSAGADDDALRIEVENTRALHDLTEQVKELNRKFSRAVGGKVGETETIEGRQHGGPVYAGRSYLVGEGGPESFVARQQGGPVFPVGARGPHLFTPAQSGAIIPANDLSPGAFHTRFRGGPLEGKYQAIVDAATAHNIPPSLMASIIGTETGWGKSRALRDYNNPAGLMSGGKGNKEFYKFDTLEKGLDKAAEVQKRIYTQGNETIAGMGEIYAPVGKGGRPVANDPHNTNRLWPGLVSNIQGTLKDPGYDPGGLQDAIAPTTQTAGIAPSSSLPIGFRGGARAAEEAELGPSPIPSLQQVGSPGFRGGRASAEEGEAHLPSASENRAQIERLTGESGVSQQPEQQTAAVAGRQEGGPVESVRDRARKKPAPFIDPGEVDLPKIPVPKFGSEQFDPRKLQRAVEKIKNEDVEWQLRIDRVLKRNLDNRRFSEFESAEPPEGYGPGTGLPDPGFFQEREKKLEKQLEEYEGYYDKPGWSDRNKTRRPPGEDQFNPQTGKPLAPLHGGVQASLAPGSLKSIENESPGYEATGSLNVNVRAPRGTSVKAEGTGPFETVNMTRKMTGDQQLGTG